MTWVALDEADNMPLRFWRRIVAALDQLQPGIAENTLAPPEGFLRPFLDLGPPTVKPHSAFARPGLNPGPALEGLRHA